MVINKGGWFSGRVMIPLRSGRGANQNKNKSEEAS